MNVSKFNLLGEEIDIKDILSREILQLNSNTQNLLIVSKYGGNFRTINEAVTYAKTYCSESNRVSILITSGTYYEHITLNPNPGIDFIGIGNVEIVSNANYPESCIYTVGKGLFYNITFLASNSYAIHIEAQAVGNNNYIKGEMLFINCKFFNTDNKYASFGAGLGNGIVLRMIHCEFNSNINNAGLYMHNYPISNGGSMEGIFKDCKFTGSGNNLITIDDACNMQGYKDTFLILSFINNECYENANNKLQFRKGNPIEIYKWFNSNNIFLRNCFGNNVSGLNTKQFSVNLTGIIERTGPYYLGCQMPLSENISNHFSINISKLIVQGVGESTFDSVSKSYNMLSCHLTNSNLSSINYGDSLATVTFTPND